MVFGEIRRPNNSFQRVEGVTLTRTQEKVYDVAWSGDRRVGSDAKLPPVGNTVDVENANWTNTIGASELGAVWTDPDFDPGQKAFYYARVIEIPTPRWSTYDAFRFGIPVPEGATDFHPGTSLYVVHLVCAIVQSGYPGLTPKVGQGSAQMLKW